MADDAIYEQALKAQAIGSSAAGQGVPPANAQQAIRAAPLTGVPASVGMHTPEDTSAALSAEREYAGLSHPSVASFAASDPAKAAATRDDWGTMGGLATSVNDFLSPIRASIAQLGTDIGRLAKAQPGTGGLLPGTSQVEQRAGSVGADVFGLAGSPFAGVANVLAHPLSLLAPVPNIKGGTFDQQESQRRLANAISTAFMGLGAGRVAPEIPPGAIDLGAAHVVPTEPAPPGTPRLAPPGVRPEESPAYTAQAQADVSSVAAMQEQAAATSFHADLPQLTEEFLSDHTPAGAHSVFVDPQKIVELASQGHSVLPGYEGEVARALMTGGDVEVPLSHYITATAGQPFAEELNAATRFREGGASLEEAQQLGTEQTPPKPTEPLIPSDVIEAEPALRTYAAGVDNAVEEVFKEHGLTQLFADAKAAGMTEGQFQRYAAAIDEARAELHDKLMQRAYDQVRRERTPDFRAAVQLHTEEAIKSIEGQKNVQTYRALRDPALKLDSDIVRSLHPDLVDSVPRAVLKKGGLHPDEAAELAGYSTGASLVEDMAMLGRAVEAGGGDLQKYIRNRAKVFAEEQARQMTGFDVSPEALMEAAREAVVAPKIEDILAEDLRAFADQHGLPFDKENVRRFAEGAFEQLPVTQARKPKAFAENMRRAGNRAEKALLDGDVLKAFGDKQGQLIQYHLMRQAFDFQKEFAKADKQFRNLAKKPITKGMDQTARNVLRWIVREIGYNVQSGKYEGVDAALKGLTYDKYVEGLRARGLEPVEATIPKKSPNEMSVNEFRGVADTVASIAQLGRWEKKVFAEGQAADLADIAEEIKANADAIGRPFTAGEMHRLKGKLAGLPGRAGRGLGAAVARPETFLYWLDRETNGPLMRFVVNELQRGKFAKADSIKRISDMYNEFLKGQPDGWAKSLEAAVDVPELTYSTDKNGVPVPWLRDRGNVVMMASHFGTESNFTKLTKGFGWDPQTVREVANRVLSEADWKYVDFIHQINRELFPQVQELYRAVTGLGLKSEEPLPIPTPYGTLPGGYRHITYDWNSIGEVTDEAGKEHFIQDPNALGNSDLFGGDYRVATPSNRHTLERTNFSAPMNLEHDILHREIESVLHDLAYRKGLIQATKILRRGEVRQAIRESLGQSYLDSLNGWLKGIARQSVYDQTELKGATALVRGARRRFTLVQIGYNVSTLLKHGGIAASHISGEVGIPQFSRASADLMRDPELQRFVDENSGEVRGSLLNLDRDVREIMENIFREQGFIEAYRYHAFTMFGAVKRVEAMATWLAKYRMLTEEQGLEHADAVALADKAVRDTQGAGSPVDLPSLWRGGQDFWGEAGKLFNIFTNFENTVTNRMWTIMRRAPRMVEGFKDRGWAGGRRDFTKSFSDLLAFFVIPAVFATAFEAVTLGEGKRFLEHMEQNVLKGLLGGSVPFGNTLAELPRTIANYNRTGKFDFNSDNPLTEMFGLGVNTALNASKFASGKGAKVEDRWVQHAIDTAGYVFKIPTKPVSKAGQWGWDKTQGHVKDDGLLEWVRGLLFGPTPEEAKKHASSGGGRL